MASVAHPNVLSAPVSVERERGIGNAIKCRRELGMTTVAFWVAGGGRGRWWKNEELGVAAAEVEDHIQTTCFTQQAMCLAYWCLFVGLAVDLQSRLR